MGGLSLCQPLLSANPFSKPLKTISGKEPLDWFTWWEFRPRKKIFSPPPHQFPANSLLAPRAPRPLLPGRPPPTAVFNLKSSTPLPAPRTLLSPPPGRKNPKGPKIEKIQDRPPGLKFSIEIDENFKRATHQGPIFCGEFWRSGLKFSIEIEKFQSRLTFFNLWALRE